MARPPSGPIGNSPRDVRDDFVGAPPDVIKAGEPLKKTRGPVRVKSNTFHSKVSGNTAPKRADRSRPPTFRRGGWVSGYASGGFVVKPRAPEVKEHRERSAKARILDTIEDKREDMPGVQKNDTSSDQNLRGKPVKFEDKPVFTPATLKKKQKLQTGGAVPLRPVDAKVPGVPGQPGHDVVKKKFADGGGLSVFPLETPAERGRREGRKIIKEMPFNAKLRSESTERAGATQRLGRDFDTRMSTGKYDRPYDEVGDDLDIRTRAGEYARGGKVGKVMHEFKHGELHSGSSKGPIVKSRPQAIAIGLSEARKAGESVPHKRK